MYDSAAISQHGISRGDFAALVFSGSVESMQDVPGYATWSTPRKFVLPDPRLANENDFARQPGLSMPVWPHAVRPTPGVCFVFGDEGHAAVGQLREQGGVECEHYVVLPRLTRERLLERRLVAFARAAEDRPIALLGYGDQGARIGELVAALGVERSRVFVVDDHADRQTAAKRMGFPIAALSDPSLESAAVISSPLRRPRSFTTIIEHARAAGRPVFDNSLPWDDRSELTSHGAIHLTAAADRAMVAEGNRLAVRDHRLTLTANIIRLDRRRVGEHSIPHLQSGHRETLSSEVAQASRLCGALDLSRNPRTDRLPALFAGFESTFIGLDNQSNQHDAALGVFAARQFLTRFWPEQVRALIPSEHRTALGASRFERLLARSITGRTLGAPYLTPIEQTALSILARVFAADSTIIEIGSALGGSTLLMAAATERRATPDSPDTGPPIYSIDPDPETRPAMRLLFEHEGFTRRLHAMDMTSDAAVGELRPLLGRAGLVFIDGLHTLDQSRRDFENYAPLVRQGGVLLFHDFDSRFSGVARTIVDHAAKDARFRPICICDTIAVFQRT